MTEIVLSVSNLSKKFGSFVAVDGISLDVRSGDIHAIIGPNGAGKTTFFNLLTKFLKPSSGTILFRKQDITSLSASRVARLGMVRSFQISAIFPHLTVIENVRLGLQRARSTGGLMDFWRSEVILGRLNDEAYELLKRVELQDFAAVDAVELSYGRKRALEIATTLALDPAVLLLDEPMAGLGREDIGRVSELIESISANRTILMVEHNLTVVANLSDRITVFARGQIIADGDYKTVSSDPQVVGAYIGTAAA